VSLLALAASLEAQSEPPLAQAIVDRGMEAGLPLVPVHDFAAVTGKGVRGSAAGRQLPLGNAGLLEEAGVDVAPVAADVKRLQSQGQTVMYVGVDGHLAGLVGITDPVKSTTPEAIRLLRAAGICIVMLTGDNPITAEAVGHRLELDDVKGGVLPQDEYHQVQALQQAGRIVAMAGKTVSTMHRRSRRPTSASRWAPAPTSR